MANPMIYQPSPFLQSYGAGGTYNPISTGNMFSDGGARNLLASNGAFMDGLDAMRLGETNLPEGSFFDNLRTKWRMNEGGTLGKINDFVQEKGGGWGNVLGGLSSLMEMYTGWKSLGLEQDKFDFSRDAWNKQYEATVKDYENRLRDRWAARNEVAQLRGIPVQSEQAFLAERAIGG